MVELKNDEKNGVLPTTNALKWFIKKQITKCRKSYLGYLCSVSTYQIYANTRFQEIRKFYSFLTNILATLYL